jgi:hypothetical protein
MFIQFSFHKDLIVEMGHAVIGPILEYYLSLIEQIIRLVPGEA